MAARAGVALPEIVRKHEAEILTDWMDALRADPAARRDLVQGDELREQAATFLRLVGQGLQRGQTRDIRGPEWAEMREFLESVSSSRARQGFTPAETATFIFSLKRSLFHQLRAELGREPEALAGEMWAATELIDKLGLYVTDVHQKTREAVIRRQQQEMLELSTPVVELWDELLALPLIGTLDSERTQVIMESLLTRIVETGAATAIIDITGVPTVDTLVAQHLLKTVAAARLMGTDCIISGIRPQIAQTIVHLGVDLGEVTTKATLADAFRLALERAGLTVVRAARRA